MIKIEFSLLIIIFVCQLKPTIGYLEDRIHYGDEPNLFLRSIVGRLEFPYKGSWPRPLDCSSVIIGPNTLLSATHCFADPYVVDYKVITLCNGEETVFYIDISTLQSMKTESGELDTHPRHDICQVKTKESFTKCRENKIANVSCNMYQGEKMYIAGYGANEDGIKQKTVSWIPVTLVVPDRHGDFTYQYNVDIKDGALRHDGGDSGGPCFDEDWNVIGVIRGRNPESTQFICTALWPHYNDFMLND